MILSNNYVFAYHNVSNNLSIGLNDIRINKFLSHIKFYNNIKSNAVEICFDDGYQDIYTNTFDYLNKTNIKKIVFVISDYIGKKNKWDINFIINKKKHLSKDELLHMYKNNWIIGSHGMSHKPLSQLTNDQLIVELKESKEKLEAAMKEEDLDSMKKALEDIQQASQAIGQMAYQQAAEEQAQAQSSEGDSKEVDDDNVVDVDYEEVEEESK